MKTARKKVSHPKSIRFKEIEKELKKEFRRTKSPEYRDRLDLGTISDIATTGGSGEPLGESFTPRKKKAA